MIPPNSEQYIEENSEPQQQRNIATAYMSPIDRYGSQISILTNPNETLHEFELKLRCLKIDENGDYIKIGGKNWMPMLNDFGINTLFTCMQPILNPMVPLSNLDEHEIGILMRQLSYNLVDAFMCHPEKYGLNRQTRKYIVGATFEFCYIFLKRPFMEGDRKFFGKITQEIKSLQEVKKPSSFSLNPFKMFNR